MATTLSVSGIKSGFSWDLQKTNTFGANTSNSGSFSYSSSLATGTGVDKANLFYATQATLAASGVLDLDLSNSSTLDPLSTAVAFTKVKLIYIEVVTDPDAVAVGSGITVGGHASAAMSTFFGDSTDKIKIKQGGCFQLTCNTAAGYAVTATTADIIKIVNDDSSAGVIVRIGIVGEA